MNELAEAGKFLEFAKQRGVTMFLTWQGVGSKRRVFAWHEGMSPAESMSIGYWVENWDRLFPVDITADEIARLAEILESRPD